LEFFQEALASVHAQTFEDWELLLVDDGSGASTTAFALQHAHEHPECVRYVEFAGHAHRGIGAARNLGLRFAHGEYVASLDADDVWVPRKLEQQVAALQKAQGVGWIYGRTRIWYGWTGTAADELRDYVQPHARVTGVLVPEGRVDPPGLLRGYVNGTIHPPSMSNVMFRRSVALQCGGTDEAFALLEDVTLASKLSLASPGIVSNECWDLYRQHMGSMCTTTSRSTAWRARGQFARWLAEYLETMGSRDQELDRALSRELWLARSGLIGRYALATRGRISRFLARLEGR
jgi:glycosyltransferase involved in cell wall biosynthesis